MRKVYTHNIHKGVKLLGYCEESSVGANLDGELAEVDVGVSSNGLEMFGIHKEGHGTPKELKCEYVSILLCTTL